MFQPFRESVDLLLNLGDVFGCSPADICLDNSDQRPDGLARAREEAAALHGYDYWLLNDDAAGAGERLRAIVLAEQARVARIIVEPGP